ncbi:hypothetical protein M8C21_026251 [Ambrosia artemisiifolia]|uniref:DUF4378 domain-containing protein n=1 Tax=Ambrosia artemisiifolia TaxID=4212 RepID=A0AAD5CQZ9_AMBAR|nr:hypothetical protein M8C21_026251 [Ambrosia artemisiifolia]
MGKRMRLQSSKLSLQNNSNSGCVNKILDALSHRHQLQNVLKGLPNTRHGSGKQIIDGGSSEATASTSQPPEVPKKNKPPKINEQESAETRSKRFRIRSLISKEMAKRRGKNQWRRSSSTHSPKKKDNFNTNCQSPTTTKKKIKFDICAAMLTVSYLRQQAADRIPDEKPAQIESRNVGLIKCLSFPLLAANTKTSDFELQELKHKLRDVKDIQTTKDKFILPMNRWTGSPKPMLTRPASFRTTAASSSRTDQKKQAAHQSKSLKQKMGLVIKVDGRKEKRRILMDAVFHKVPYGGRKSSKETKKIGPIKLKSSKNSSADKTHLKRTSSTSEAMSKYRKLLSQTSMTTRDEKLMQRHSTDHKPRLFVAGNRKTLKRMRSLPNISPYDFMPNQEFPVKPDIHLNTRYDDQISTDRFVYPERRIVPGKQETKLDENMRLGTYNHQEKTNQQSDQSEAAFKSEAKNETSSTEKDEAIQENLNHKSQEQNDNQRHVVDEDNGVDLNSSNHQEEPRVAIQVENDKSFSEILGMFKKVSDEKLSHANESSDVVPKQVAKNTAVGQRVPQNVEVHNVEDTSPSTSGYKVDENLRVEKEDSSFGSSSLIDIPNSRLEDENKRPIMDMTAADETANNGFLHLDLESVKDNAEFQYVKQVLEKSGFLKNALLGEWYSSYQPIDPMLFEEIETSFLQTKLLDELDLMKDEEVVQKIINDHHLLLFDLINEALLEIHNRTYTYCPHPLTYRSKMRPMPVGCRVLEQVWDFVNMYLSLKPELQTSLDDVVSHDLAKGSGWMNLQADAEFVGIELEELLVDDLLDELVFDDLLM